ncbi:hypothetical protein EG68_06571, partial [Paragonimus skrjabini miyazakii]
CRGLKGLCYVIDDTSSVSSSPTPPTSAKGSNGTEFVGCICSGFTPEDEWDTTVCGHRPVKFGKRCQSHESCRSIGAECSVKRTQYTTGDGNYDTDSLTKLVEGSTHSSPSKMDHTEQIQNICQCPLNKIPVFQLVTSDYVCLTLASQIQPECKHCYQLGGVCYELSSSKNYPFQIYKCMCPAVTKLGLVSALQQFSQQTPTNGQCIGGFCAGLSNREVNAFKLRGHAAPENDICGSQLITVECTTHEVKVCLHLSSTPNLFNNFRDGFLRLVVWKHHQPVSLNWTTSDQKIYQYHQQQEEKWDQREQLVCTDCQLDEAVPYKCGLYRMKYQNGLVYFGTIRILSSKSNEELHDEILYEFTCPVKKLSQTSMIRHMSSRYDGNLFPNTIHNQEVRKDFHAKAAQTFSLKIVALQSSTKSLHDEPSYPDYDRKTLKFMLIIEQLESELSLQYMFVEYCVYDMYNNISWKLLKHMDIR